MANIKRAKTSFKAAAMFAMMVVAFVGLMHDETGPAALEGDGIKDSQCRVCHTDVKKLIRLSWEVEKIKPSRKQSSETSGEG